MKQRSPIDKAKGYEVAWQDVAPVFEAARPYADAVFVYFIGEPDGPIKIGHSKDPIGRLRQMQTGNPRRLRVEHVLVGGMHIEKLLHEMWERHAVISARNAGKADAPPGTEWFDQACRADLKPILITAAANQVAVLVEDGASLQLLEKVVREAHAWHGFVAHQRHQTRLLGAQGGYVTPRRSRI